MSYINNTGLARFFAGLKKKFVMVAAQTLTTAQKNQVRQNIGIDTLYNAFTVSSTAINVGGRYIDNALFR